MNVRKFLKKYKFILLGVLLIIIFIGGSLRKNAAQKTANSVESARVIHGDLKETLTLSGSIGANERVLLRFQTGGKLTYVGVKEGDYVYKNRRIASLDQRELQKNLKKRLNLFLKNRWELDQVRDDNDEKVINDTIKRTIDQAQFDVDNSVLDVEIQHITIEFANLIAPIEGIVTSITTPHAGVNISPSDAQFEIINPKSIYFTINADQSEVTSLTPGMMGDLVLDAFPDKTLKTKVATIAFTPTTGETGTVYGVKSTVVENNKDFLYRVGMTGDVSFTTKVKKNVLYIPIQFVKERGNKKYVIIRKNGKPLEQEVKTGMETENNIEITSGLSEGDIVYD